MLRQYAVIVALICAVINFSDLAYGKCTVEQRIKLGEQGYNKDEINQFCNDDVKSDVTIDDSSQVVPEKPKKAKKVVKKEITPSENSNDDPSEIDGFTSTAGFPGTTPSNPQQPSFPAPTPQLACCDQFNMKRCAITINPGPIGSPCSCFGIPGVGHICM